MVGAASGRRLWGWMGPGEALDAVGASPDVASQAPSAARLWAAAGHAPVHSVLAVDVAGLADLLVGLVNLGANEPDPLRSVSVTGAIRPRPGEDAGRLTLSVTIHDGGSSVPSLVDGPAPGLGASPGEYLGMLVVNLPADVETAAVTHASSLVAEGRISSSAVPAPFVDLLPGETRTWTIAATLPPSGQVVVLSSARVPSKRWRFDGATFTDSSHRVVCR